MKWREGKKKNYSSLRKRKLSTSIVVFIVFMMSFTTMLVFMPVPVKAAIPVINVEIPFWSLDDNCYAQSNEYQIITTFTFGASPNEIEYAELKFGQDNAPADGVFLGPELYAHFKYTPDPMGGPGNPGSVFEIISGADYWELTSSPISDDFVQLPLDVRLTWKFKPKWNAENLNDVNDIDVYVFCKSTGIEPNTADVMYTASPYVFDVVTDLAINDIHSRFDGEADDRVDVGSTLAMHFQVCYANDPGSSTADPATGILVTDEIQNISLVNVTGGSKKYVGKAGAYDTGVGAITFTAPSSVGSWDYQLNTTMDDEDWNNRNGPKTLTNNQETVITDRIAINWSATDYTPDSGTEVTISLDDIIYDYDNAAVSGYQYDVTKTWGSSVTTYKDDFSSSSFTFTPNIAGIYNFTISSINESTYDITANQTNDTTLQLISKQKIDLVAGVNYVTWGANSSISAKTLAENFGMITDESIQRFSPNPSSGLWTDDRYVAGPSGGGNFVINRWDDLLITVTEARSYSFIPDYGTDTPNTKTIDFTAANKGWYYVTWTKGSSVAPADFASTLGIDGINIDIVLMDGTANSPYYNAKWGFGDLTSIDSYDVLCFRGKASYDDIEYDTSDF